MRHRTKKEIVEDSIIEIEERLDVCLKDFDNDRLYDLIWNATNIVGKIQTELDERELN